MKREAKGKEKVNWVRTRVISLLCHGEQTIADFALGGQELIRRNISFLSDRGDRLGGLERHVFLLLAERTLGVGTILQVDLRLLLGGDLRAEGALAQIIQ